jgi:hypothetical protein
VSLFPKSLAVKSLVGAAAILCAAGSAHGQQPAAAGTACPLQPSYPLPTAQADLRDLAGRLDSVASEKACLGDAFFHAWRGAVLLALGEPAAAIEPLERALLTRPDLPAAELDLAVALEAVGDTRSAAGLFAELQRRTDLPEPLRAALERHQAQMASAPSRATWRNRVQISSLVGYDTNLNNAPAATELTLTLPQGNVTLPLASTSLARAGGVWLNTLQWQGLRPAGKSVWLLQGELRARNTGDADTAYQQADVAATWLQAPEETHQWIARMGATHLRFGGRSLLSTQRVGLQYQWPRISQNLAGADAFAQCRPAAGLELEQRGYPATPEFDGLYRAAIVGLQCTPDLPGVSPVFYLQLRLGRDRPDDATRPGGSQTRNELRMQWEMPLPSPWQGVFGPGRLGLNWASAWQTDSTGYSPLLSNNAVRQVQRHAMQAEANFSLGGGLSAIFSSELSRQKSNLEVFKSNQRSVYLGLRWELM